MSTRKADTPGPLTIAVAAELRAEMGRRKMSAVTLARTSGVGARSLARYLIPERTFSLEQLDLMAKALGLTSGAEVLIASRERLRGIEDVG